MLVFCLVVLVCIIVDQFEVFPTQDENGPVKVSCFRYLKTRVLRSRSISRYEQAVANKPRLFWLARVRLDSGDRVWRAIQGTILLGAEIVFVGLTIVLITDYARILLPNNFQTLDLKAWSLGQVIAVSIWVPVLIEYFWLAASMLFPSECVYGINC